MLEITKDTAILAQPNIIINGICIFLYLCFLAGIGLDRTRKKRWTALSLLILFSLLESVADLTFVTTVGTGAPVWVMTLAVCVENICGYQCVLLFCAYVYQNHANNRPLWRNIMIANQFICLFSQLCCLVLGFSQKYFYFYKGEYHRGDFWGLMYIYPAIAFFGLLTVFFVGKFNKIDRAIYLLFCLIPITSVALAFQYQGISYIILFNLCNVIVLYTGTYVQKTRRLYERELELQTSRVETMVSQIQPHFLYNSITAAVALCDTDPQLAGETMANFGKYLRTNLESLKLKEPVPFEKELKHIDTYFKLEKTRFGDKIALQKELAVKDFEIPALSVQPLIENSVKHGITCTEKDGVVLLKTTEDEQNIYVEVSDNGCGFDTSAPIDKTVHFGLDNIQTRLKNMINATMKIESQVGVGTKTVITIPKKSQHKK